MVTHETVTEIRDIVQKIIIPIVFVIGLIGNSITVIVLTRKSMRCSTNVYLTALAVTDILYLTTTFLLTLQHYQSLHLYHPLYWRCFGLIIWFHDGLSYISIYIATCFTIERFIAVRYPIRRQQFCTEELAKKVIVGISIFCIALTASTAFEYSVDVKENYFNTETNQPCPPAVVMNLQDHPINITRQPDIFDDGVVNDIDDDIVGRTLPTIPNNEIIKTSMPKNETTENVIKNMTCIDYHKYTYSEFGQDEQYYTIFFHFTTIVFVIIPLTILITFNTFLIVLVRKSRTLRTEMTNMSIRKSKKPSAKSLTATRTSKVSQENKITIVLIAVVILFIICQLPWSIYLIIQNYKEIDENLKFFLGNIFNLLVDINSAINFFLYCVLSDKYRKTVKELINSIRNHNRHQVSSTGYSFKTRNGSRYYTSTNTESTTMDMSLSEFTRQGTLTTSWNRHSSRYTFNHRQNSIRNKDISRKPRDIKYPMQLLNKQLNRLDTSNQTRHEYIPLHEDINSIATISTATSTATSLTNPIIINSSSSSSSKANQYNKMQQHYPLHQQHHQQQQHNKFSYPLNNIGLNNNNFSLQPGTSSNNTSPYNIYNTYSNSKNNAKHWNIDNRPIKTNQLLMLQHQHKPIQNSKNYHLMDQQQQQQQQHINRSCPYYTNIKNLNKIWTRPTNTTTVATTMMLMPDEYYMDNQQHHNHLQHQQQDQNQKQYQQQRRRSLSLTSLPKIKHAPSCKDFPDDL